jgi:hypothetical protein
MTLRGYVNPKNTTGERLVYIRRDGLVYTLHAPPWRAVLNQEGFGAPPIEYVADRAPFQHGDTVRSFYLAPRTMQIVVLHNFCSRADYWQGREEFLNLLRPGIGTNPVKAGQLRYYLPGHKQRQIDVLLESGPGYTPQEGWREWTFIEAIRFTAHDPSWYDPAVTAKTLLFGQPLVQLVFPATFPIWFSETAGLINFIDYFGTWVAYPTVAVTGPVTGFHLRNAVTGDQLGLTAPVPAGYTVTFTLQGIKTIMGSDGANWANRVSPDSDLTTFALVPAPLAPDGRNTLELSGTGTNTASRVVLSYNERFFGI